jgi:hypothetical protein
VKNAVDWVQSSHRDSISGLSAIDSETADTDVGWITYEYDLKKLKAKVKSVHVSVSVPGPDPSVLKELRDDITVAKSATDDAKARADEAQRESLDSADKVKKDVGCIKYE